MKTTKNIILISVAVMAIIIFTFQIFFSLYILQKDSLLLSETILINSVVKEAEIIAHEIGEISQNARVLALLIGNTDNLDPKVFDQFIKETISDVKFAFGMGYWFEPYYFDTSEKYYGPYIYKDKNDELIRTMEYSTKAYDYFSHDWYNNSIVSDKLTTYSSPFYDEYLDTVFLTAAVKIIEDREQIGVVSIDITLREINEYLREVSESKDVSAFIITEKGSFWGDSEGLELDLEDSILESKNNELKALGGIVLQDNESDSAILENNIYVWSTIGDTDLTLIMGYPKSKVLSPLYRRTISNIIIFILAMVLFILLLNIILTQLIEKPLIKIINENLSQVHEEGINVEALENRDPNFDNMIKLIQTLLTERQRYIYKLNGINSLLLSKNKEIEGLYHKTDSMNKKLMNLLDEIQKGYIVTVRSLSNAIEAKDRYTKGHCKNVTEYSLGTAKILGLTDDDLVVLEYAALLHDVGKIGVPSAILNKPSKLTDEEFDIIKSHPTIGYEILKDIDFLKRSALIVYQHHERMDGKGYPRGINKDELDILTRILTVTDAYDAMTSARPYRKVPLSHEKALVILEEASGSQFDGKVVEAFREYMNKRRSKNLKK